VVRATLYATIAATLTACGGDNSITPTVRSAATTLGNVHLSPLNAIMAVGDTMTLTVTGQTLSGAPITSFDSVVYGLQNAVDSLRVQVSRSGVVTALAQSSSNNPVIVQAIAFKDGLARGDVATVQVTTSSFSGATLSVQPVPPDIAQLAVGMDKSIVPVIKNPVTNDQVQGVAVRYEYHASDSAKMQCYVPRFHVTAPLTETQLQSTPCGSSGVNLNGIRGNTTGLAWIVANVRVYGVTLRDSVQYLITNPPYQVATISQNVLGIQSAELNTYIIAPGGSMFFFNAFHSEFGASVSWTFEDSTAATVSDFPTDDGGTSGNIPPIGGFRYATRRFLNPGTYKWTATVSGGIPPFTGATTTGQIIVQ